MEQIILELQSTQEPTNQQQKGFFAFSYYHHATEESVLGEFLSFVISFVIISSFTI
jgi:hypothetical protein